MSGGSSSRLRTDALHHDGVSITTTRPDPTARGCWPHHAIAWPGGPPSVQAVGTCMVRVIARVEVVPLRVVFADDNYLAREGVCALLAEGEGIEIVDTAADLASLMRSVAEHVPDVVLTDIRMPPSQTNEGIEAARRIRAEHPGVGVVVLSQYVEEDYAFALLAEGAAGVGYLLKERVGDRDEISRALAEVARGGLVLGPLVVEALLARRGTEGPLLGLTDRDRAGKHKEGGTPPQQHD